MYATFSDFYVYEGFLVMILLGALFSKRHGRLAVLLPLGYLLPTVLFGRIRNDWPAHATPEFAFMLSVSATALAYRFLVALAAPLWIVRSANGQRQKRSSVISMGVLLAILAGSNLFTFFYYGWIPDLWSTITLTTTTLIVWTGIALAVSLYRTLPAAAPHEDAWANATTLP